MQIIFLGIIISRNLSMVGNSDFESNIFWSFAIVVFIYFVYIWFDEFEYLLKMFICWCLFKKKCIVIACFTCSSSFVLHFCCFVNIIIGTFSSCLIQYIYSSVVSYGRYCLIGDLNQLWLTIFRYTFISHNTIY